MESFDRLVALMEQLRAPGGCPWDRAQTHATLREFLLEETSEVLDAIDDDDTDMMAEELGDLLLQIVFHAELAREAGRFDVDTVCRGIGDKLVARHPHVFGEVDGIGTAEAVLPLWEAQKAAEKGARDSALDGVPRAMSQLARSYKLQRRAARAGFDWPDQRSRLDKVVEELDELERAVAAGDRGEVEAEYGDLLFMMVNVGRGLGLQAEDALRRANAKFERRYRDMERRAGGVAAFAGLDLEQQDGLWNAVKADETDEQVAGAARQVPQGERLDPPSDGGQRGL